MPQICTQGAQINTATGPPRMRVGSGWDVGTHILGAGGAPDMACPILVTDPGGGGDDRRAALAFRRASNCLAAPAPMGRAGIQGEEAGPPPHWDWFCRFSVRGERIRIHMYIRP